MGENPGAPGASSGWMNGMGMTNIFDIHQRPQSLSLGSWDLSKMQENMTANLSIPGIPQLPGLSLNAEAASGAAKAIELEAAGARASEKAALEARMESMEKSIKRLAESIQVLEKDKEQPPAAGCFPRICGLFSCTRQQATEDGPFSEAQGEVPSTETTLPAKADGEETTPYDALPAGNEAPAKPKSRMTMFGRKTKESAPKEEQEAEAPMPVDAETEETEPNRNSGTLSTSNGATKYGV